MGLRAADVAGTTLKNLTSLFAGLGRGGRARPKKPTIDRAAGEVSEYEPDEDEEDTESDEFMPDGTPNPKSKKRTAKSTNPEPDSDPSPPRKRVRKQPRPKHSPPKVTRASANPSVPATRSAADPEVPPTRKRPSRAAKGKAKVDEGVTANRPPRPGNLRQAEVWESGDEEEMNEEELQEEYEEEQDTAAEKEVATFISQSMADAGDLEGVVSGQKSVFDPDHLQWSRGAKGSTEPPYVEENAPKWAGGKTGPMGDVRGVTDPLFILMKLWPLSLWESICEETNRYATHMLAAGKADAWMKKLWKPLQVGVLLKWIGIYIAMSLMDLPSASDYWRIDTQGCIRFPAFGDATGMSWNHFRTIKKMLHIRNNEGRPMTDKKSRAYKLWQMEIIIDTLRATYKQYFSPGKVVTVDEAMFPCRNRMNPLRVYYPKKPHRRRPRRPRHRRARERSDHGNSCAVHGSVLLPLCALSAPYNCPIHCLLKYCSVHCSVHSSCNACLV
jgi:Transposase IS4